VPNVIDYTPTWTMVAGEWVGENNCALLIAHCGIKQTDPRS
jgi:hypothetical protein